MLLNVGCGDFYKSGWINVDIAPVKKDATMDGRNLAFPDGTFDKVYLGHVIEHVAQDDAAVMLSEAFRVLKVDGEIMVVAPDSDQVEHFHSTGRMSDKFYTDTLHGQQRWHGDEHLWLPLERDIEALVADAGFRVAGVGITSMPSGWPIVAKEGWQLAVWGVKNTVGVWCDCGGGKFSLSYNTTSTENGINLDIYSAECQTCGATFDKGPILDHIKGVAAAQGTL